LTLFLHFETVKKRFENKFFKNNNYSTIFFPFFVEKLRKFFSKHMLNLMYLYFVSFFSKVIFQAGTGTELLRKESTKIKNVASKFILGGAY